MKKICVLVSVLVALSFSLAGKEPEAQSILKAQSILDQEHAKAMDLFYNSVGDGISDNIKLVLNKKIKLKATNQWTQMIRDFGLGKYRYTVVHALSSLTPGGRETRWVTIAYPRKLVGPKTDVSSVTNLVTCRRDLWLLDEGRWTVIPDEFIGWMEMTYLNNGFESIIDRSYK